MKKALFLFATILFAIQMQAQDINLLNRIKAVNSAVNSLESELTKTLIKSKKTITQTGKLYYVSPKEFSAQFTTGKYMIVNERKAKVDIGIFHGTFKLKDGSTIQSLSHIFLFGFQGRLQDLADENDYSLSTKTENGILVVTATNNKKRLIGMGYKRVTFKFDNESLLLQGIILHDHKGNEDTYTISNAKYNVQIDRKIFQF